LEEGPASGPGERAAQFGFLVARRLADEEDASRHRAADDHRLGHARTSGAPLEFGQMLVDLGNGRHAQ